EERRGGELQPALTGPIRAQAVYDVVAFVPLVHHLRDHFRWILQIRVDHHHAVASRVVDPCGDGNLMSEVARELDQPNARVSGSETYKLAVRIVLATVVNEQNLVVAAANRAYCRGRPHMKGCDPVSFVEHRDDHRDKTIPIHLASGATPAVYRCPSSLLPKLGHQEKSSTLILLSSLKQPQEANACSIRE